MGSLESWRLFLQIGFRQHYLVLLILFLLSCSCSLNRFRSKFLQIGYCQNYLCSEQGISSPTSFFLPSANAILFSSEFLLSSDELLQVGSIVQPKGLPPGPRWHPAGLWDGLSWWQVLMLCKQYVSWSTIYYIFFPSDLAYKLYDRKAKCLLPFKRMKEVKESWKKGWGCRRKGYFKTSNKPRGERENCKPDECLNNSFYSQIIGLPSFTTLYSYRIINLPHFG